MAVRGARRSGEICEELGCKCVRSGGWNQRRCTARSDRRNRMMSLTRGQGGGQEGEKTWRGSGWVHGFTP
jgi:hypothetical protein